MGSSASGSSNCIAMSTTAVTIRDSSEWRLVKA
jgi:hypothetical protein